MSSTYSPILRTELIGAGDQPGTWGASTNSNFQYIFETAIAGYQTITVTPTSNNQVLTYVNGPSATPSLNQAIYAVLKLNAGTLSANFNIFAPPVSKTYTIWNNTSYTATFYNSSVIGNTTAAGSGVAIPAGAKVVIWSDGTNFWSIDSTTGNLTVAGNVGITGTLGVTGITNFTGNVYAASGLDGTTGIAQGYGSRIRMDATNAQAILQFTNNAANAQIGSIVANGSTLALNPPTGGTITAPTASPGTNTTQIATTAFALANGIPSGAIVMWSGSIASIPSGWYLCNGANGTPNLQDRFIVGAGSAYAVAATGGTTDATLVAHTHTATSTVSDPGHVHNMEKYNKRAPDNNYGTEVIAPSGFGSYVGTYPTAGATTGITVSTTNTTVGSSATNANLPPYYALAYIMKA